MGYGSEVEMMEMKGQFPSVTKNYSFDRKGYIECKNFIDPDLFNKDIIFDKGGLWFAKDGKIQAESDGEQVERGFAMHSRPDHKYLHTLVRQKIEKRIGVPLFNTYYYERFYYPGCELKRHHDRDVCEISATVHIASNLKNPWAFYIESNGEAKEFLLSAGDAVIYKGNKYDHWRNKMPGRKRQPFRWILGKPYYYHQIFFHYVLSNGYNSHLQGQG